MNTPAIGYTESARPLRRSPSERVVAGVCAGIAHYLGVDPLVVRVGAVLLTLIVGWEVVAGYVVAALLIPRERSRTRARGIAGHDSGVVLGLVLLALGLFPLSPPLIPWLMSFEILGAVVLIAVGVGVLTGIKR